MYTFEADTRQVRAKCSKCGLATKWVDESLDYGAKEEAAEAWNERHKEIYQDDFGGITADELERALKEFVQELVTMKNKKKSIEKPEVPYMRTPRLQHQRDRIRWFQHICDYDM